MRRVRGNGVCAVTETIATLGDALPREMARVRDEILPRYLEIGSAGQFGAAIALKLCLAAPVPMPEFIGEMAHDGYGYAYGGPLTGEVLLVSLRDGQDNQRFMLVFPDETA